MKTKTTLKQQQKELAITLMKKLDIYQPYIDCFEKEKMAYCHINNYWTYRDWYIENISFLFFCIESKLGDFTPCKSTYL